jgi:hypothetical protein
MNEIETLYNKHASDTPVVDEWIDSQYADVDEVRAFSPIAEMRGTFTDTPSNRAYRYTFTPDKSGKYRAITMPLFEHGVMVDIVAFRANQNRKKLDVWGTVTDAGRFLNHAAIYDKLRTSPLRVYETWWQWLVQGCKGGVFPLCNAAYPLLRDAGDVVVNDFAHALQLVYSGWVFPAGADWEAAKAEGRQRVWIDDGDDERAAA